MRKLVMKLWIILNNNGSPWVLFYANHKFFDSYNIKILIFFITKYYIMTFHFDEKIYHFILKMNEFDEKRNH